MQTREQKFAAEVYTQVEHYLSNSHDDQKKYGSMAHKLPVLVRTAGLAQALAFVHSRGQEPHKQLLEDLAQVVVGASAAELLKQSRNAELQGYMYLTERTMLALKWYKRFSESMLKVEATDEGG